MKYFTKKINCIIIFLFLFCNHSFTQTFEEIPNHPTGNSLDIQAFNKLSKGKPSPNEFILEYEALSTPGIVVSHFSYDKTQDQINEIPINVTPNAGFTTLYVTYFKEKHYFIADGNKFWEYDPVTGETKLIPLPVSAITLNGLAGELDGKIYINAFQKLYAFDGVEMTLVNTNWNGLTFFGFVNSPENTDDIWLYFFDGNNNEQVTLASFDGTDYTSLIVFPLGSQPWQSPGPAEDKTYFHLLTNGIESPLLSFDGTDLVEYIIPFDNYGVERYITTIGGIDMLRPNSAEGLYLNDNGNFTHQLSDYNDIKYRGEINGGHYFSGTNSNQATVIFIYNPSDGSFNETTFEVSGHTFIEMGAIHNDINFLAFQNDNTLDTVLVTYDGTQYQVYDNPLNRQYINFRGALGSELFFAYRDSDTGEGRAFRFDNSMTTSFKEIEELDTATEIFPNPAKNFTNITIKCHYDIEELNINLFSINGKLLQQYQYNQLKNNQFSQEIETSSLPDGIYLLQIVSEFGALTKKLIVN